MVDASGSDDKQPPSDVTTELSIEKLRLDAELKIEGMKADVRKVVFGTMIVGLAAAFFPFAQELAKSWFARSVETIRQESEFAILQEENRLAQQLEELKHGLEQRRQSAEDLIARRNYLEGLADEARSERIERQIIIAEFFSFLGEPDMREQWVGFREYLIAKQTNLNNERTQLLKSLETSGDTESSSAARAAAVERLEQIDRLQNPTESVTMPSFDLFREKAPTIMRSLMEDLDLTVIQAAGILGNIGHESNGFYYNQQKLVVPGSRGGIGWSRWTGPRRREFEKWALENGYNDLLSDDANYGYLIHELQTTEAHALKHLRATKTLVDATRSFMDRFERPGIKHFEHRMRWATEAFAVFQERYSNTSNSTENE